MGNIFVAVVDYGLGNLFSVKEACKKMGLNAVITSSRDEILKSSAVILTGVGAFGKAMETLYDKGLVGVLRDYALSGKPLVGICLGMQLLMSESYEFGHFSGSNIVEGKVIRLKTNSPDKNRLKIPLIGWERIHPINGAGAAGAWKGTLLEGLPIGAQMYFVHSYFVKPAKKEIVLSETRYGDNEFCSSIHFNNISAFQFHPECSGPYGLKIYENLAKQLLKK